MLQRLQIATTNLQLRFDGPLLRTDQKGFAAHHYIAVVNLQRRLEDTLRILSGLKGLCHEISKGQI